MEFGFITDTPLTLEGARSRIQVAEIGAGWKDPRYGTFGIADKDVANWKKLLASKFQGRVPIDEDHKTDKGVSSEASGWLTSLDIEGSKVMADVEWNSKGEAAIQDKRYMYLSPTFVSDYTDQRGESHGPALLRVALTNNPFLRDMPAVSLSAGADAHRERLADELTSILDAVKPTPIEPKETKVSPDSRQSMSDTTKLLGLPDDADDATILAAVTALKDKADTPATEPTTLEAQAKEAGVILLTVDEATQLRQDASEGKAAAVTLHESRFETEFAKTLNDGRIDAKPESKDFYKSIYDLDADKGILALQKLTKVVSLSASGAPVSKTQSGAEVPAGGNDAQFELDARVRAVLAEDPKADYTETAFRLLAEAN